MGNGSDAAVWRPVLAMVSALALAGALGLAATAYVALRTSRGRRLDVESRDAVSSPDLALHRLQEGLGWVSAGSVGLSLLVCLIVALMRRRLDLAVAAAAAALIGVATVLGRWHRPSDVIAATFVCVVWAAVGVLAASLLRQHVFDHARRVSAHFGALIGVSAVGGLLVSWGVRPQPGLRDLGLGLVSLGAIALACALSVGAVAHVANRHLG